MADNPGVYPLDPTTDVGRFRLLLGDTNAVEFDPPREGVRNYPRLSDEEIEAYIEAGGGSLARGIGFYYMALSGEAAMESQTVKDYDLSVNLTARSGDLRNVALMWFERADSEGEGEIEDAFEVVPTGTRQATCYPELAARPIWRL